MLLKNLPGGVGATVHMAVFTPESCMIEMEWNWEGEDDALLGGRAVKAMRSLVRLKIGGFTGVLASLIEKNPSDLRCWLVTVDVSVFTIFEGAMFVKGRSGGWRWPR